MSAWSATWRQQAIGVLFRGSRSDVPACLREFRKLEAAPVAVIRRYQRDRLLALLRHCRAKVPYYRRLFEDCDLDLSDDFAIPDLERLPLLTKEIIRREGDELISADWTERGGFRNSSGGSTGKPIVFLQDRAYYARNVIAAKIIYNEILGKDIGELEFNLWGSERDIVRGSLGARQKLINYLYNRRFQNFFRVDDRRLAAYCDEINRHKPVSIWAYVGALELLAGYIRRNGIEIHSPRFIISTAGTLHPALRETVQAVFRCPVYNQYGSREVGAIAFETHDRDGLRGMPYLNYVEVVDGRVIVTCLTNYSMPLLRYDIGDTAEPWTGPQDETYGCRHKIFRAVTGRVHSHFRNAAGEVVHGGYFSKQFYFLDWVRQFQVVQERVDRVVCRIVPAGQPVDADLAGIRERIRRAMGAACEVEFEFTERIAPAPSGKHMYTICQLDDAGRL